ncbi:DNA polymerase III subunit delta [Amaricoccus tamworthensis]|uniref:DNA polymerase III subunit delta n=1 Tax=Amaricoccus tamworthensis TaxID=57002 RepID=UPI003C79C8C4
MKLNTRDAQKFFAKPDRNAAAILIYGTDAVRVALRRRELLLTLVGENAADEMRLTRLSGADVRRDPASVNDAMKATGFFPGDRAVFVEEAGDGVTAAIKSAIADWQPGDAQILLTAGQLGPRSSLRKLFEGEKRAYCIAIYQDPPGRAEIAASLEKSGISGVSREAMTDLDILARSLDPGDFSQFMEKLGLYKLGDGTDLMPGDIAACAPAVQGAEMDTLIHLAADGKRDGLASEFARLTEQGTNATGITIAAARHFRALHAAAIDPEGPDRALARARPPVFGPARSRMAAQARRLGPAGVENALAMIMEAELRLRSGKPVPGLAFVERLLVKIASLERV